MTYHKPSKCRLKTFCIFGQVTANNPAGFCHVKVWDDSFRCCSKDCKTIVSKAKQLKAKNICIHVHILICLGVTSSDKIVVSSSPALACVQPLFPQANPASTSSGAELFCTNAVGSEIPSSTKAGSLTQTIPNSAASVSQWIL